MKITELRTKDRAALNVELKELLKTKVGLRMQLATQQLSNTSQMKKIRRAIAQVHTVLTEQAN